jgi:hypothetical protein
MSRHPLVLPLLLLLPLGSLPLAAQTTRIAVIVVPGLRNLPPRQLTDTMGTPMVVHHPVEQVFTALSQVYADLKIPIELRDSVKLQLGNPAFYGRGSLGGRRMSAAIECGTSMTGSRADDYRIYLSLVSFLYPGGRDSTLLRSVLMATAVNVTEVRERSVNCPSLGELERRIHEAVVKKLGNR